MTQVFDIAVIGGGINGCGIAADAALRGLSVLLLEKDDLASKTSSNSSKLIHGGLRYLEQYDFGLVKKALDERQTLLKIAPHLVYPLPFVLPYDQSMRPTWLLRTGLFFYDHLSAKNQLPKSRLIKREKSPAYFDPLSSRYRKGFLFYDCATDDARLTITNALQAREHGAKIYTGCEVIKAETQHNQWRINVKFAPGEDSFFKAKALVNAGGPWVEELNQRLQINNHYKMAWVKGSHILVPKCYEGSHAYLLQNEDNRIIFILPYHHFTMIGTTDVACSSLLSPIQISDEEIEYLLDITNRYLKTKLDKNDIVHSWSGIRPLIAAEKTNPQALSRDYAYEYTELPAPAVCLYGGKITTYRQLSEKAVDALKPLFPAMKNSCSNNHVLPGGDFKGLNFEGYQAKILQQYSWLSSQTLKRMLHTYGSRIEMLLAHCTKIADLGEHFGHGLYQQEVDYLVHYEWAKNADDILWRRTKLGLYFKPHEMQKLSYYLYEFYHLMPC